MVLDSSRFDVTRIDGDTITVNSQSITVIERDDNDNISRCRGTVTITNAASGYAVGCLYMDIDASAGAIFYINEGSTTSCNFNAIDPSASGGGGSGSLDSAYSIGQSITVDEGAVALTDATTSTEHTLSLTQTGAKSGNILDVSVDAALTGDAVAIDMNLGIAARGIFIDNGGTARTGSDILVTDDSTGNHSVIDINSSGSGASIGFDWVGSNNGSPGGSAISLTFDNADNLDTNAILITRGTGVHTGPVMNVDDGSTGSADMFDIDLTGIYTGNIFDFATTAASTGNVFNANLDNAVAMTAIHIEGSGVRTQPFIELITDATGAADLIDISVDGAVTGDVIDIDLNLGLACRALFIDAGNGTRTANLVDITHDGDGNVDVFQIAASNTGSGHIFDINVSGIHTGNVLDIVYSAAATGDAINLDMTSAVAASALTLVGAGARTDDLIKIDDASTGSGSVFDINMTGIYTGTIFDVAFTAAATGDVFAINMTNAVAAKAGLFTGAGARTDDMFEINDSSTGNAHIWDVNMSGVYTGNVLDITYSASAATGNAIDLNMGTNVAGMAISVGSAATGTSDEGSCLDVAHTGDLAAGADVVRIESTGNISSTSNLLSLEQNTGAGTAGTNVLHINAAGTNVEAIEVEAGLVFFATATANGAGNDETIVSSANVSFYDPNGASRTGVILAAGLRDGQHCKVVNFANAAEDITFAASGTSNVAGGTSVVISRFEYTEFIWHAGTSLWYAGNLT